MSINDDEYLIYSINRFVFIEFKNIIYAETFEKILSGSLEVLFSIVYKR